jgi:hypothetical protein
MQAMHGLCYLKGSCALRSGFTFPSAYKLRRAALVFHFEACHSCMMTALSSCLLNKAVRGVINDILCRIKPLIIRAALGLCWLRMISQQQLAARFIRAVSWSLELIMSAEVLSRERVFPGGMFHSRSGVAARRLTKHATSLASAFPCRVGKPPLTRGNTYSLGTCTSCSLDVEMKS